MQPITGTIQMNAPDTFASAVLTVDEFCATCKIGRTGFYVAVGSGLIRPLVPRQHPWHRFEVVI